MSSTSSEAIAKPILRFCFRTGGRAGPNALRATPAAAGAGSTVKMAMDKTPASEWRPRPWHVRVRGSPRPLAIWRVRVRAASASAGVRSGVRWRPRPSRVRVHGTSASTARLRPLPSASTARPRPRHVHVHGASASAAVRVRVRFCVCSPAARRVTGRSLPRKDINPTPGGLDLLRPANQTQDGGAQLLAEGARSPGGTEGMGRPPDRTALLEAPGSFTNNGPHQGAERPFVVFFAFRSFVL